MNYKLVFLTGKYKGKRLVIGEGSVVIGRYADCQIDLDDDDEVSRRHAVLETRKDGVYIRDLGALNSVTVNGQKVNEAKLSNGDTVELGNTQFQFEMAHPPSVSTRRRRDTVQVAAIITVTLLLVGQVAYLFFLSGWGQPDNIGKPDVPEAEVIEVAKSALAPAAEDRKAEIKEEPEVIPAPAPPVKPVEAIPPPEEETPVEVVPPPEKKKPAEVKEPAEPVTREAPPVQATPPSDTEAGQEKVEELKEEMATLKAEVEKLKEEEAEPEVYEDPVVAKAKAMMRSTLRMVAANDMRGADQELERLQIMAPDFLPAYVERARLYERRGELELAGKMWGEVIKRSMGTPMYEQASAERMRLARVIQARKAQPSIKKPTAKSGLPEHIEIFKIDRERFKTTGDFDEMRLIRVELKPNIKEKSLDAYDVRIEVVFFDRDLDAGTIQPTRVVVPDEPLTVDGPWESKDRKTVTAAYIVPRGFRVDEEDEYGERLGYYGYAVQVYYLDMLQDEEARPMELLKKMSEHKASKERMLLPEE